MSERSGTEAGTTAATTENGTPPVPAENGTTRAPAADAVPAAQAADAAPAAAGGAPESRSADIVPGPGGVMTDEVGVVTGELTLRTEFAAGQVTLRVQYREADEWYTVTGGRVALPDVSGLDAVHGLAVGLLHRPEG
ncbi:hypothetical protein [Micromonospora inyonensis]|uniref:Uncharacterized protein n=1 Tax=Micromonospora inyonensis TaxID=47866 RepID=A0A1C6RCY9_9ACTN|nr:hypothetical protein GA0074694_0995 [Micromonospora inyonensis]